jgi:hypothetical protein
VPRPGKAIEGLSEVEDEQVQEERELCSELDYCP